MSYGAKLPTRQTEHLDKFVMNAPPNTRYNVGSSKRDQPVSEEELSKHVGIRGTSSSRLNVNGGPPLCPWARSSKPGKFNPPPRNCYTHPTKEL